MIHSTELIVHFGSELARVNNFDTAIGDSNNMACQDIREKIDWLSVTVSPPESRGRLTRYDHFSVNS
jgi:hypothetical protein